MDQELQIVDVPLVSTFYSIDKMIQKFTFINYYDKLVLTRCNGSSVADMIVMLHNFNFYTGNLKVSGYTSIFLYIRYDAMTSLRVTCADIIHSHL